MRNFFGFCNCCILVFLQDPVLFLKKSMEISYDNACRLILMLPSLGGKGVYKIKSITK